MLHSEQTRSGAGTAQEVQVTSPQCHMATAELPGWHQGLRPGDGHLLGSVSQATTEDHCLQWASATTLQLETSGQTSRAALQGQTHPPSVGQCHSCSPAPHPAHRQHPTATSSLERSHQKKCIISKIPLEQHSHGSICFKDDQREDLKDLQPLL